MKKPQINVYQLVLAGLLTAIGLILPRIFHTFGISGSIFLPMHLPVLLCGLLCGPQLGGLCGVIVLVLNVLLAGMPPPYPVGVYMGCELLAYGVAAGLLRKQNVFVALISSMLIGRVVLAVAQIVIFGMAGNSFVIKAFFVSAFVTPLPGIIIELILIPACILALKKTTFAGRLYQ